MSVTVRPYVNGGWEVDIRVQLPDGSVIRDARRRLRRASWRPRSGPSLASECCSSMASRSQ
jgi:hypothetical protein